MLTAFLPAAAALLTSATNAFTTNVHQNQYHNQYDSSFSRLHSLYADKQESAPFYQQLFATKQTMLPQLLFDDVQINENIVMNTTELTTTTWPTASYLPPALSHVALPPPRTTTTAADAAALTITTTTRSPFAYLPTTLISSAISAVTSTLVKTTANPTMATRPSSTLQSSLLLASTSSAISAMGASTTISPMFFEGDLLPAVFLNANDISNNNNSNESNNSRNNSTLGLGGVVGVVGSGVNIDDDDDDNLNSFYFYEVSQPYSSNN